jgi:hypothetical protein
MSTHEILSVGGEMRKQQMEELLKLRKELEELQNRPTELGELSPEERADLILLPKKISGLEETLGLNEKAA